MTNYTPNNPPAFPKANNPIQGGMSLRDWFAGQVIGTPKFLELKPEAAARHAYLYADSMLLARSTFNDSDNRREEG